MDGWTLGELGRQMQGATRDEDGLCIVVVSDTPAESLAAVIADLEQPQELAVVAVSAIEPLYDRPA